MGTFLCRPLNDTDSTHYEIIRLTTTIIPQLSQKLFTGGIKNLLTLDTQEIDEKPYFSSKEAEINEGTITFNHEKITKTPESNRLSGIESEMVI